MAEEEVEALQAVYGDDCLLLQTYPPSFHLHIKPRTADDSSQQFVEAIIGIQAGSKYPDEPPTIRIVDSKGLDELRQRQLISCISERACELSSCLMLVALCETEKEDFYSSRGAGFYIEKLLGFWFNGTKVHPQCVVERMARVQLLHRSGSLAGNRSVYPHFLTCESTRVGKLNHMGFLGCKRIT